MKYCCEKFKSEISLKREQGLNIRIIKYNKAELLDTSNLYRFFITAGYTSTDKAVPTMNIAYCPFCGQNLFEFYKKDKYVNESDSSFLYP